jgi:outer membrane protein assembly factor BamA
VGEEPDVSTNGLTLGIEYDNRDFANNPSLGSLTKFKITRDFGVLDSFNSWTSVAFSFSKYRNLGRTANFAQRVFAANVWSTYVPTWTRELISPDYVVFRNRPPSNRGARLGGVDRLRGYPRARFNDKAAIYYGAELRLIPYWDPFRAWPVIRNWPWRWWQVVGFAEIGRVAPSWDFGDLHDDMKWTLGTGIRAMIGAGVIRFDYAVSDEASVFWVMASQAF